MTCGLELTPWGGVSMSTIQWRFWVVEGLKEGYVVAAATLVMDQLQQGEEDDERLKWFVLLGNLMFNGSSWIWGAFGFGKDNVWHLLSETDTERSSMSVSQSYGLVRGYSNKSECLSQWQWQHKLRTVAYLPKLLLCHNWTAELVNGLLFITRGLGEI